MNYYETVAKHASLHRKILNLKIRKRAFISYKRIKDI